MTFQRWAAPLLAGATLVACTDAPTTTPAAPPVTLQTVNAAVIQQQTEHVAAGIARALDNPANRRALHVALQTSTFSDHKTALKKFVHSAQGTGLVNAAAAALGESREQFITAVDALPAMDFYMPFRENRLTWKWSDEVVVAASFDGDAPQLTATDGQGRPHVLRLADGAPTTPLVIIHPAEPVVRIPTPAGAKGEYIEASTELDLRREALKHYQPGGVMKNLECDPGAIFCDDDGGSGSSSPPPPPPPGVYITDFDSYRGDGWFGSEIEIQWHPQGFEGWPEWLGGSYWLIPTACNKGYAEADLPTTGNWNIQILLSPGITNVNNVDCGNPYAVPRGYFIQIVEIDGGLNGGNDDFGRGFFKPGTMPFGFTVGTYHDYYSECGDPGGCGQLSVLMRVQYR